MCCGQSCDRKTSTGLPTRTRACALLFCPPLAGIMSLNSSLVAERPRRGAHVVVRVGRHLVMAAVVVPPVVDAAQPADADATDVEDICVAEKVDVGRRPSAMVELPVVVARLVVSGDED
eukprot:5313717-Prymnesium_polylepis.1